MRPVYIINVPQMYNTLITKRALCYLTISVPHNRIIVDYILS